MLLPEQLRSFEKRVEQAFLAKKILAPIHLSSGNEWPLIKIFQKIRPQDWVFSTWRSHYHALLKGISEEWIFGEILAGRSMYLMNKEHKFLSSAIVGGILPIASGVALGAKRLGLDEVAWVFVGDMTARTGIFSEFSEYCTGRELPVKIVIEDNGRSTNTPTEEVWGKCKKLLLHRRYIYRRTYPHVGVGRRVDF